MLGGFLSMVIGPACSQRAGGCPSIYRTAQFGSGTSFTLAQSSGKTPPPKPTSLAVVLLIAIVIWVLSFLGVGERSEVICNDSNSGIFGIANVVDLSDSSRPHWRIAPTATLAPIQLSN